MAHAVKYRMQYKVTVGTETITAVVEILQDGYAGGVTDVKAGGDMYRLEYEKINPKRPFEKPAQKGRLEMYLKVRSTGPDSHLNYDGPAIINELFGAEEDTYRMRLSLDGSQVFTGSVLNDLSERPGGQYTYEAKIVAKDLSRLATPDFDLDTGQEKIIETIASILATLGYGLDIYTYTSWVESNTTLADDFLDQIYNEKRAMREYADNGDEPDEPFKQLDLLELILKNYCLVLRQDGGAWRLYQLSAMATPGAVQETIYDAAGVKQSASTVDMTFDVDRLSKFTLPRGLERQIGALKVATVLFDHRASAEHLKLPEYISFDGAGSEDYSQQFVSNGAQLLQLSTSILVKYPDPSLSGYVDLLIKVGQYYFNGTSWTETVSKARQALTGSPTQTQIEGGTDYYVYSAYLSITTPPVPTDALSPITIGFENAVIDNNVPIQTFFQNIGFSVNDTSEEEANSRSIEYRLTQENNFSTSYNHGRTLFGDGPATGPSALRYATANHSITSNTWQRRGSANYRNMHENLLKEILDLQRVPTMLKGGTMVGRYPARKVPEHEGKNLFYLGGALTGIDHRTEGDFWELNLQTDA